MSDDEQVEYTTENTDEHTTRHTTGHTSENAPPGVFSHRQDDDDDRPPPPAAAACLIAADQVERSVHYNTAIVAPFIPTSAIYNVFSWLGSSIYSLATLPGYFMSSSTPEQDHEKIMTTIRKLDLHLKFLDNKIDKMNDNTIKYGERAKKLWRNKNKTSAMHQIRLKKMYDKEIQKLEALKFNIESHILHMDSVDIMMVTVDTIKSTSDYFQNMNNAINISQLENTLDEMVDHRDTATDIQSILSDINAFSDNNFDEADLLKELEEMSQEEGETSSTTTASPGNTTMISQSCVDVSNLPHAPTHALPRRMDMSSSVPNLPTIYERKGEEEMSL